MTLAKIVQTNLSDASPVTRNIIAATSDETRFFYGLDNRTRRDLLMFPPKNSEPISHMGLSGNQVNYTIRPWINREFRRPKDMRVLISGEIKTSTTYADLRTIAGL